MQITQSKVVIPSLLNESERSKLTDDLYRVHSDIFDGVSRDAFAHYVIESPADDTRILLHHNARGEVVGYFAAHQFNRVLRGQPSAVLRGEAGLLRAYRGGAANIRFGVSNVARILLEQRGKPVYYLGCLVHPSSYYNLAKYTQTLWPHREHPISAEHLALMSELGDSFGLEPVGDHPLVRQVGWCTRDSEAERAFWQRCDKPDVRFFVETNPGYGAGHGLLTLVPMTPAFVKEAVGTLLGEKKRVYAEGVRSKLYRAPLVSHWLLPREVEKKLRGVPLFDQLTPSHIAGLAAHAEVLSVDAGQTLIRQGDLSQEMYVIASGAVHILVNRRGEEILLEQLDGGDVFGEIAALAGERRTATARTATKATIIRLQSQDLLKAMGADHKLHEAIWDRYTERRFEEVAVAQKMLARLTKSSRQALLRQGSALNLKDGERHTWPNPGFIFVVRGEVVVEHGSTRLSARSPMLIEVVEKAAIEARSETRVVYIPAPSASKVLDLFGVHPLLAKLPRENLAKLVEVGSLVRLGRGELLFAAGDVADAFYLLKSGAVDVLVDGEAVARLGAGECFGERGLDPAGDGRRAAGVRAVGASDLLRVSASVFLEQAGPHIFGKHVLHGVSGEAEQPVRAERKQRELTALVGAAWTLTPPAQVRQYQFKKNDTIIRENDPVDAVWYLVEGVVRVEHDGEVIRHIYPGESFGERALLLNTQDSRRLASVVAHTDATANKVDAGAFLAWCREQPKLKDVLASVSQIHVTGGEARTTTVHKGSHEGEPCVVAVAKLEGGAVFTSLKLESRDVLILSNDDGGGEATGEVEYERAAVGTRRRLGYRGSRPVSVVLEGDLGAAAALGERLRSERPLTRGELERFRWTGRLGAIKAGEDRLICGCVGLTRRDLRGSKAAGCRTVDDVKARTGAGSVCGGCVPLMRRLMSVGEEVGDNVRYEDEVDLDSFEARLDGLRHVDKELSLFKPGSVLWKVYGESAVLLGGMRALLLQFAHPLSQGLVEHSSFMVDAAERFHQTLHYMYGMAFGEGATMLKLAREVHEKHAGVVGRYKETRGTYKAAARYSANQVDLLLWVAATVVDTSVLVYEALVGELSEDEKDQLVVDAADLFGLFGIPKAQFPATWRAFRVYFDAELASETLRVDANAMALASAVLTAPKIQNKPIYALLKALTAHWLPVHLRAPYQLGDSALDRMKGEALVQMIRVIVKQLPHNLRVCPARLNAERRLRGETGPDPAAVRADQLISILLGARVPNSRTPPAPSHARSVRGG